MTRAQDAATQERLAGELTALREQYAQWEAHSDTQRGLAALSSSEARAESGAASQVALQAQVTALEQQVRIGPCACCRCERRLLLSVLGRIVF